jgi:hypothetical protein
MTSEDGPVRVRTLLALAEGEHHGDVRVGGSGRAARGKPRALRVTAVGIESMGLARDTA